MKRANMYIREIERLRVDRSKLLTSLHRVLDELRWLYEHKIVLRDSRKGTIARAIINGTESEKEAKESSRLDIKL